MESWLDVQPLKIPRPKLLSSAAEAAEIRTLVATEMIKNSTFEAQAESVRKKLATVGKWGSPWQWTCDQETFLVFSQRISYTNVAEQLMVFS